MITPDMYNDLTVNKAVFWGRIIIDTVKEVITIGLSSKYGIFKNPVEIKVKNSYLVIRKCDADRIMVNYI